MTNIQQWLEQKYPNKNGIKKIELEYSDKNINLGWLFKNTFD